MRYFLPWVFFLLSVSNLFGQEKFVKYIAKGNGDREPVVVGTQDLGWVIFSPDSFLLYKFNACGLFQWGKQFQITPSVFKGLDFFIGTRNGGFAFLAQLDGPGSRFTQVVSLDPNGNILWTKVLKDSLYSQITYSIDQDLNGDFMVYGSASKIGGGDVYSMLTKISEAGNYLWTRFYNHSGFWGGAICTSDSGFLARTGNTHIKTDKNGLVQWTSLFETGGQFYDTPLEVSDGYIINGRSNVTAQYAIAKLTKSGAPAWPHKKVLTSFQNVPHFRNCPNGNIASIANLYSNGQSRFGVMELSPDLTFVRHNAAKFDNSNLLINANYLSFASNGIPLLAGSVAMGDVPMLPNLFFAKMNAGYQTGCDTLLPSSIIKFEPVSASLIATSSTSYAFLFEDKPLQASDVTSEINSICGNATALAVKIEGDQILCANQTGKLRLKTGDEFDGYQWSEGSVTSEINISEPGTYWVKATNSCRQESASDTIEVTQIQFSAQALLAEYTLCSSDSVKLDATSAGATYTWNTGESSAAIYVAHPGTYSVRLLHSGCSTEWSTEVKDCHILVIPTLFTPNNDQENDRFIAGKIKGVAKTELDIFNRWGKKLFSTSDFSKNGWDGENHDAGIYFWVLHYQTFDGKNKTANGIIQLQR